MLGGRDYRTKTLKIGTIPPKSECMVYLITTKETYITTKLLQLLQNKNIQKKARKHRTISITSIYKSKCFLNSTKHLKFVAYKEFNK